MAGMIACAIAPAFASDEASDQIVAQNWHQLLAQADSAIQAGRLVQAETMLIWLEHNAPQAAMNDVALAKAEYYMSKGNVVEASSALATVDKYTGDTCKFSKVGGWVAGKNAEYSQAILLLAAAIERCGEDAALWNLFGLSLLGKGETAAALEAFDSAILLAPRHPALLNNRALALLASGRADAALSDLQTALQYSPEDIVAGTNADYLSGLTGREPVRRDGESDSAWAQRLATVGEGARAASRTNDAKAYFAQATLHYERFDPRIWSLGSAQQQDKAD